MRVISKSGPDIKLVPTGTSNLASVRAALERLGCRVSLVSGVEDLTRAERLVLPGVGTLGAAMERLRRDGFVDALRERLQRGQPTLAICLGLQLLCDGSQENPSVSGLGVVPGRVTEFPGELTVPHMGWNRVVPHEGCRYVREEGHAYFANSYRLESLGHGGGGASPWQMATCNYGGRFVAALERDGVLACQFHPELSGAWGSRLLERWLAGAGAERDCAGGIRC